VVSGINYDGSEHSYPYAIMPAWQGGDMWGMDRFAHVCAEFAPDVVIINNDWWNVAGFLKDKPRNLPLLGYMPVDGANLNRAIVPQLKELAAAIWYTDFGYQQAVAAGFEGARHVIPHGLDSSRFRPVEKGVARRLLELPVPEGAFIVGNINRNQPRKRLDLTIQYFAEWVHSRKVKDAWLLLHCAWNDTGWDLESVARYHGVADRLVFTGGEHMRASAGESMMQLIFSSMDVQVSTTLGEGWGLTTMEGMACGVPQIVPDWAALAEWPLPAEKVPCSTTLVHPEINTVGGLPDKGPFVEKLHSLYRSPARRRQLGHQGLAFVRQEKFQWETVAGQIGAVLEEAVAAARLNQEASVVA
jgi:glycosyltransferase involved in cell wall biosynthesis